MKVRFHEPERLPNRLQLLCAAWVILQRRQLGGGALGVEKLELKRWDLSYSISSSAYFANDGRSTTSPRPASSIPVNTILSALGFS